jgi:very-short-patch-repair endonuclease
MRSQPSEAETRLWGLLRARRLSGFKFRRQHPVGRYIVDFYCARAQLVIELDGGQHAQGGQDRYDAARTQELAARGLLVLRFWNHDVLQHPQEILEEIWRRLQERIEARKPGS